MMTEIRVSPLVHLVKVLCCLYCKLSEKSVKGLVFHFFPLTDFEAKAE